ncbi:hypothetical protein [Caulobacter flavus]|nr:hypothetical protein [Caulobacter flavus]
MRFQTSALACALMLVAGTAHAAPDRAGHAGHYDNVRYIAEADDYVGARVTVRTGAQPSVVFENCMGVCSDPEVLPARIEADRLSFTYVMRSVDQDGRPAPHSYPVTGRFVRGGLILKIGEGEPEKLRKRKAIPR